MTSLGRAARAGRGLWALLWAFSSAVLALWLSAAPALAAPTLLWLSTDLTPPTRAAMVEHVGAQSGWQVRSLVVPLRALPGDDSRTHLDAAWPHADMVWIDAPHVAAAVRLKALLEHVPRTPRKKLLWVEPGDTSVATALANAPAELRVAAYLRAGGQADLRHAFTLATAWQAGTPLPELPAPQPWPQRGVYHPDAPAPFENAQAFAEWQEGQAALKGLTPVAVLVHRHHFVTASTDWLDRWLRQFKQSGLAAYAVFGSQLDPAALSALIERGPSRTPHARVVVNHLLLPQGAAMQGLFERWGVPVLATQPYRRGSEAQWLGEAATTPSSEVPFYFTQPEAAGAIDPMVVVAHGQGGRDPRLIDRQALAVVAKALRLIALQTRPLHAQRLVAMVYNYPSGAQNFGASFLNVPRSLERVSQALQEAGYRTERVAESQWVAGLQPLLAAYYPGGDLPKMLSSNQAAALPLARYQRWFATLPEAVRKRIDAHWGPPERSRYVTLWRGEPVFVIPRLQVGQLSVMPQPPREETLHMGQNPFMHRSKAPMSHHYLASYLWSREEADAVIHFGTHGTQEWAPGKQRGLDVWDDALLPLGDVPVVYPYIVDNLGEALTAKRRGRAVLVSHRTPSFTPAGFNRTMAHMHELMHEWETADAGPTRQALERTLLAQFVEHQLHNDLGWSAERIAAHFTDFLEQLHPYLDRLAQSSQPQGLAVFGVVPGELQRRQTVLQALRQPLIDALGEDIDEAFLIDHAAVSNSRPMRWLDVALQDARAASQLDLRPPMAEGPVPNRAARKSIDTPALQRLAERAQELHQRLGVEGEIPGLLNALRGGFTPAAYGGDPIRNPDSLPTGRNLTGLDPSRLPTRQAFEVAQGLFNQWFDQWRAEHQGNAPKRLALSLWAGETLRHQGVMEAQALVAMGVEPVWDASGRPTAVRLVDAAQLKRPRVDVLLSVTGSYRDQFSQLMALIDQAVAAARQAEPDNVIASHTRQVARDLQRQGVPAKDAHALAEARVFGNEPGDYGTGLSEAVQHGSLKAVDDRLGTLFLNRMSHPYVNGEPLNVAGNPAVRAAALGAHLRQTDAALLSRTSHLYGMLSSDDPFQYLGGLAAAARKAGRTAPVELFVGNLQDSADAHATRAERSIALEMQSRYLHSGWLKAQQAEGYAGTLQALKAVQFAYGWQATVPGSIRADHWQSLHDVLLRDKHGLGVPQWLKSHPGAMKQIVEQLQQADQRGYWQPDARTRAELQRWQTELSLVLAPADASKRAAGLARSDVDVGRTVAATLPPTPVGAQAPVPSTPPPAPTGLRLQRQPEAVFNVSLLEQALAALLLLALVALGGFLQTLRRKSNFQPDIA